MSDPYGAGAPSTHGTEETVELPDQPEPEPTGEERVDEPIEPNDEHRQD